jgi:hypothetical protein
MQARTHGSGSSSVLSGTSSNIVDLGVGDNVIVDGHVLLLGEDSIVSLQLVFLEVLGSLGRADLDVELESQYSII